MIKLLSTVNAALWGVPGVIVLLGVGLYLTVRLGAVQRLLPQAFLPFNLLKAGLNSALTLGLYKPMVTALRKTGLVESGAKTGASKIGIYLFAAGLLITCILLLLAFQGKI